MHPTLRHIATAALLASAVPGVAHATDPLLHRTSSSWFYGPSPVWTDGNDASPYLFTPLSEPLSAAGMINARVSYQLSEDSGACQLRPAVRYSDNGVDWDVQKEIYTGAASWQNGNNVKYQTSYVDLTSLGTTARAFMQFGVEANNDTGVGTIQLCNATLRVEWKDN